MKRLTKWRPVVGFEGFYSVSNLGVVRSLDRIITRCNNKGTQTIKGRLLKSDSGSTYPMVSLSRGRKRLQQYVHILVLEAFVGPCPRGMEACHWDDVKTNNRLSNLRWDTRKKNRVDGKRNGIVYGKTGEKSNAAKLTEKAVMLIREFSEDWTITKLAKEFGVTRTTIRAVIKRRTWKLIDTNGEDDEDDIEEDGDE